MKGYQQGLSDGKRLKTESQSESKTNTDRACFTRQDLRASAAGSYVDHSQANSIGQGGDSVLSQEECDQARQVCMPPGGEKRHERHLVAFMTPILTERLLPVFPSHIILVNTEEYSWIRQPSGRKKLNVTPDGMICPEYLVQFRGAYENAPLPECNFGQLATFSTRKSVVAVLDAKVELDDSGRGDFISYLKLLSANDNHGTVIMKGFVHDHQHCDLMTAINGNIVQQTHFSWTTPGSLDLLKNYLSGSENNWHNGLVAMCRALNVNLDMLGCDSVGRLKTYKESCILGAGAFGRVFKVRQDAEANVQALKVVVGTATSCQELQEEFEIISSMKGVEPYVVGVVAHSFRSVVLAEDFVAAAYLMPSAGKPFSNWEDLDDTDCKLILVSLSELHAKLQIHGDARYRNVIRYQVPGQHREATNYRWVDFRSGPFSSFAVTRDVTAFLLSVFRRGNEDAVSEYAKFVNIWTEGVRREAAIALWSTATMV